MSEQYGRHLVSSLARYQQLMNEQGPDSPAAREFRRRCADDAELDEMLETAYWLVKKCEMAPAEAWQVVRIRNAKRYEQPPVDKLEWQDAGGGSSDG